MKKRYKQSIMGEIERLCLEKYEQVQLVNEQFYDSFLILSDSNMKTLVQLILDSTYKNINKHVLSGEWDDSDIYNYVMLFLELIFEGKMAFNASDGKMCFFKPLGPPPSPLTWKEMQSRIGASRPIIESVFMETLAEQDKAESRSKAKPPMRLSPKPPTLAKAGVQGYPTTVNEAVDRLMQDLDEKTKRSIASLSEKDLVLSHYGLGQYIRNEYGLWKSNPDLLQDTGSSDADTASAFIVRRLWETLRGERRKATSKRPANTGGFMGIFDFLKSKKPESDNILDRMSPSDREAFNKSTAIVVQQAFPDGEAQVEQEAEQLFRALRGKVDKDRAKRILYRNKLRLVDLRYEPKERLIESILCSKDFSGLSKDDAQIVYRCLTGGTTGEPYLGGDGFSEQTAVIVNVNTTILGIPTEYMWIESKYGRRDVDWTKVVQLNITGSNGKPYDIITIKLADGKSIKLYFEISAFYGKT